MNPTNQLRPYGISNCSDQVLVNITIRYLKSACVRQRLWGSADKSLARPTSRWHRTESIMSWERGVCSCAELQVFSCYRGWKEACQVRRSISTTSRRELSSSLFVCFLFFFFSARQGAKGNSRHSDRNIGGTCTIVCHRQKLRGQV